MVFGRGRKAKQEQLTDTGETGEAEAVDAGAAAGATDGAARNAGPYDASEIDNQDGYVDLGALLIAPREGLQLRLEVGEAALDRSAAAGLEELFRQIVVVRGENPMPPRDLLQLRLPRDSGAPAPQGAPEFDQPERGPEITQIG